MTDKTHADRLAEAWEKANSENKVLGLGVNTKGYSYGCFKDGWNSALADYRASKEDGGQSLENAKSRIAELEAALEKKEEDVINIPLADFLFEELWPVYLEREGGGETDAVAAPKKLEEHAFKWAIGQTVNAFEDGHRCYEKVKHLLGAQSAGDDELVERLRTIQSYFSDIYESEYEQEGYALSDESKSAFKESGDRFFNMHEDLYTAISRLQSPAQGWVEVDEPRFAPDYLKQAESVWLWDGVDHHEHAAWDEEQQDFFFCHGGMFYTIDYTHARLPIAPPQKTEG